MLAHILKHTPIQVWGVDADLRLTYLQGGSVESELERPTHSYVGRPLAEIMDGDAHRVIAPHRRALEGSPQSYEVVWHGRVFWAHLEPMHGPGETRVGGVAVDVTDLHRAQREAREASHQLGLAVEAARAGAWHLDLDPEAPEDLGRARLTLSPRLRAFLGFGPEEGPQTVEEWHDRILPEDRPELEEAAASHLQDPARPYHVRYRIRHRDGSLRRIESHGQVLHGQKGRPTRWAGLDFDVTEEDRLRRRFEHLFHHLGQGVVYQDAAGAIIDGNEAAREILGLSEDQLLGRSSMDPEWEALREDGTPFPGEEHPAMVALRENRIVHGVVMGVRNRRTGHRRWIRATSVPRAGMDGAPVEVFTSFEDITALRDAQEEIRARERRFDRLLEHAADGVAVLSPEGRILHTTRSTARLLSLDPEALAEADFLSFVHPEDAVKLAAGLRAVAADRHAQLRLLCRVRGGNGELSLHLHLTSGLEDDAIGGIAVNLHDVTEEERLLDQVHQLQKMEAVGRLAGGVAHDFNNLLTSILGFAALMADAVPAEAEEDLEEIIRAGTRGRELTRQLLQFSRREERSLDIFDLAEVVARMERMLRRLLPEDLHLAVEVERGAWIEADRNQLEQVVMNLVINARDATPSGGSITVEVARAPEDGVSLRVEDTGKGIEPRQVRHIFEPFFTTKAPGHGTGLGLSTVHGIVEQTGGTIQVHSEPGAGACFHIVLPRSPAPPDPTAPTGGGKATVAVRAEGQRVLVVDDDPAVRKLMRRILEGDGFQVVTASTPEQALAEMDDAAGIDLLISDVVLPGMTGPELADRLAAADPRLAVILISGYTEEELGEAAERYPLLSKPFEPAELVRVVKEALAERDGASV